MSSFAGNKFAGGGTRTETGVVTSRISHTSFDARNAYKQSLFWSKVLDWAENPDDPNLPDHEECLIVSPDRTQLVLFITVPDDKVVKNRIHLDLRPVDFSREEEVARLTALGAVQIADFRRDDGSGSDHARRSGGQRVLRPLSGTCRYGAVHIAARLVSGGSGTSVPSALVDPEPPGAAISALPQWHPSGGRSQSPSGKRSSRAVFPSRWISYASALGFSLIASWRSVGLRAHLRHGLHRAD